jgi:hypothetical protein
LSIEPHHQPLPILFGTSPGRECSGGELRTYVLTAMIVLLQGINVRSHEYLCWRVMMIATLFYVIMTSKNNQSKRIIRNPLN